LKHTIREHQKLIKTFTGSSKKAGSIAFYKAKGEHTKTLEAQLKELEAKVEPVEAKILDLEMRLKPYEEILNKLKAAKKRLRDHQRKFVKRLNEAREALSQEECRELVLDILREKLEGNLDAYVSAHRQLVVAAVENWWDKYATPIQTIAKERDNASQQLEKFIRRIAYVQ